MDVNELDQIFERGKVSPPSKIMSLKRFTNDAIGFG